VTTSPPFATSSSAAASGASAGGHAAPAPSAGPHSLPPGSLPPGSLPPASTAPSSTPGLAPLIDVRGLGRSYGSLVAVKDISFSVGRGEVVGFLGPNGAGKSTTLRMIVGYLGPTTGSVRVNGFDVVEQPLLARKSMGYMPETAPLYPEMRVREYLTFRARLKGIPPREIRAQVELVLFKAGVTEVVRTLIGTLSRGFRQRVALADALLNNPPLLILDEPTAGLDPNQIHSVRQVIRELGASHTVLLSTHILSEVESTCTRALVIDRGVLVAQGSIAELRRRRGQQRAIVTVYDVRQQALGLMLGSEHVLGVTPVGSRPSLVSLVPPASPEDIAAYGADAIVSLLVTFDAGADANACLEEVVALLVRSGIRVREARLKQSSMEDVFRQLTGADVEAS
jgi:gliding motility-associated transport system ATP-binding protein